MRLSGKLATKFALATLWLAGGTACGQPPPVAPSPTPNLERLIAEGHWLAFQSDRDGNGEIYVMDLARLDAGQAINLTRSPGSEADPAWSTDGARLAFVAEHVGTTEVYVLTITEAVPGNAKPERITHDDGLDSTPAWSPNGKWITYGSARQVDPGDLFAAARDGLAQQQLTNGLGADSGPAWARDGKRLSFYSDRDGNGEIYVMALDETLPEMGAAPPVNLTQNPAEDVFPTWSPDGTRIAFASNRAGNFEIYVMGADGSALARLTQNDAIDTRPAWSPDGKQIAFESARDGNSEIYVMNVDGSAQTNVSQNPAGDYAPAWRP